MVATQAVIAIFFYTEPVALLPVSFRLFQPRFPLPNRIMWFLVRHPRLGGMLEYLNVPKPHLSRQERSAFWKLIRMRRMSSLAVGLILQDAVKHMPEGHSYVNVGVWEGFTLFAGMIGNPGKECIGVDNFSEFDKPRHKFLRMFETLKSPHHRYIDEDFEQYFKRSHQGPIGVYFYDGAHDYESQKRGLEAAEPFLVSGSLIIVDDTNREAPRRATEEFLAQRAPAYRLLLDVSTSCEGHPTWWNGLMVLQKA